MQSISCTPQYSDIGKAVVLGLTLKYCQLSPNFKFFLSSLFGPAETTYYWFPHWIVRIAIHYGAVRINAHKVLEKIKNRS
ncbi:MAG TPA: hypothetical protein VHF65_04020 [Nitrososphaera sp.]|nr:hypothetical protein [Nitrososphaera sp.]